MSDRAVSDRAASDRAASDWAQVEEDRAASDHITVQERFLSRPVALVGFMGVGKSSVGRELARLLDRPFLDTDVIVEERSGRSIPELFAEGEPVFRRFEREALHSALSVPRCVVALGGGAFAQPGCPEYLLPRALVVHLYTPWTALLALLPQLEQDRPMIRHRASWQAQDLFLARGASYRRAHVRVNLPRHGAVESAQSVARILQRPEPATRAAEADAQEG